MKKTSTQIIVIVLIMAGVLLGLTSLSRPKLVPANAPSTDFSAERAMEHISAISQTPHPPGSAEIESVRAYVLAQLEDMGLSPEVQDTTYVVSWGTSAEATAIQNIIVKISGTNPSKAILLDAHYDTRAMTPGASDCGSCVATILETARALLAGPPLQNDVILLFTDNEEYGGGLGAAAFLESHPWASEVGLVLNFEGLGSTGPAILFETGPDSAWAVKDWGKLVSHPVGQSWFQEIYGRTPIGTDLNWFSDAGIPGMNFGHWAKGTVYHASTDSPERIDPRSVQHHGSYALALTRHFGNQDLAAAQTSKGNASYFSFFPGILISYPNSWVIPLAVVAGLLLIGSAVLGLRTKQLKISGTLKGLAGYLLSLIASAGLATGIWMGIAQLHSEYQAMLTFRGLFHNAHFYFFAFAALAVVIAAAILVWLRRKSSVFELYFGALVLFWILALATSILTPGFSYLLTWPLIFCTLALGWVLWKKPSTSEVVFMLGALPGLIILAPSIYVMFHFALAPMIGILAFMVSLLLGLLIPQIALLTQNYRWRLSGISLAICVGFLVIGSLTAGFDVDNPRPNAVAYLLDSDSGQATWFSAGFVQDEWTRQFYTTEPELEAVGNLFPIAKSSGFPVMRGEASFVDLPAPEVEILDDQISGDMRTLKLILRSPRGAEVMLFDVEPYQAVRAATIADKRIEAPPSERHLWSLTYYAVPSEGIQITLELDPALTVQLQVSDQTWDLTADVLDSLGSEYQPRPADMMPMPNFDYGTVVVKTLTLEGGG
ncbi:MAG: M28 family peptidase [Anaerolineales bacterium]|nr:M28 family peptidase [Chloroflexota bacterium]MBL6982032.1 M28 family peptidase [Anaerolineales bacterium]